MLVRSHWRVNIGGGRVKLAMRSPDRATVFWGSELSSFSHLAGKSQNANLTFLKCIPVAGITFLFVNIIHSGTPGNSTGQLLKSKIKPQMAHADKLIQASRSHIGLHKRRRICCQLAHNNNQLGVPVRQF